MNSMIVREKQELASALFCWHCESCSLPFTVRCWVSPGSLMRAWGSEVTVCCRVDIAVLEIPL